MDEWKTLSKTSDLKNDPWEMFNYINVDINKEKSAINLSIGNPLQFGYFSPPITIFEALKKSASEISNNGYSEFFFGISSAREAIANRANSFGCNVNSNDIILTCGVSGAIEILFKTILTINEDTILLPRPSFFIYEQVCRVHNLKYEYYDLDPNNNWNVDLNCLEEKLKNKNIKIVVLNNPSNPTGAVFSYKHLQDILALLEKYKMPVIADEIYNSLTWDGKEFNHLASIPSNVPIIEVNGLAKMFCVTGWRVGWIIYHDKNNVLQEVKNASMSYLITLGPSKVLQSTVPYLFSETPTSYFDEYRNKLKNNIHIIEDRLNNCNGITYLKGYGGMQTLLKANFQKLNFNNSIEFCQKLKMEESVILLPGEFFGIKGGYLRICIVNTPENIEEACQRITIFCEKYNKN